MRIGSQPVHSSCSLLQLFNLNTAVYAGVLPCVSGREIGTDGRQSEVGKVHAS
jgi:hypothetical protein